jgi:hypothetical protein
MHLSSGDRCPSDTPGKHDSRTRPNLGHAARHGPSARACLSGERHGGRRRSSSIRVGSLPAPLRSPPASAHLRPGAPTPRCTGRRRIPRPRHRARRRHGRGRARLPRCARARRSLAGHRGQAPLGRPRPPRGPRRRDPAAAHGALRARRPRRAPGAHPRRMAATPAHARPPHAPRQARSRAAALAWLRRPAAGRSRPPAARRHRRAPPSQRPPAPASHQGFHRLVGHRPLWQARPYPRRPARRRRPDAIVAWVKSRPTGAIEHLLVSLPRTGRRAPLSTREIAASLPATRLRRSA